MTTALKCRIILADDHSILRNSLARLIGDFKHCTVVGQAADGVEIMELIQGGVAADLILLDLNMPGMDGYASAAWLHKNHPSIKMLVLTMYDSDLALFRLLRMGVGGFLKKDVMPEELQLAISSVMREGFYYSANPNCKFSRSLIRAATGQGSVESLGLSEEDLIFLRLAATDLTYKEIAHQLNLSLRAVEHRREALFSKLEVKSKVGLAMYAIKNGIVSF